jgi:hypothetical protein
MTNMTNEEQQKHEAAIEEWRRGVMTTIPAPRHVDVSQMRVLFTHEIDAICDLARRAPRPKPIDEGDANRLIGEPSPDPRASSALLTIAKRFASELDRLRRAMEHYKGECDQLRKERDEAVDRAEKAARDAEALADRAEKAEVALSTPPQQNHIGSILPLRGWLRRRVEGWISSHEVLEDVVELLVRRELARGAK